MISIHPHAAQTSEQRVDVLTDPLIGLASMDGIGQALMEAALSQRVATRSSVETKNACCTSACTSGQL